MRKLVVPDDMVRRIVDSEPDPLELMRKMIRSGFQEYREWLFDQLQLLQSRFPIEAAVTLINCASLRDVCSALNIPIVHMEAGCIRSGVWRISTFQFDFKGVNGNSEAAERFDRWPHRGDGRGAERIAELLLRPEALGTFERRDARGQFEIGIPLQVEDDSNLVAYGNGDSNLTALYRARLLFPPELLLARNHPLALMTLKEHPNIAMVDDSPTSLDFVGRCQRILTINSSVAFEGMLMGRPTYILGDSPLLPGAYSRLDRHMRDELAPKRRLSDFLEFITFNYLIPYDLWMNPDYIRYRLGSPSEDDIRALHLHHIHRELAAQA